MMTSGRVFLGAWLFLNALLAAMAQAEDWPQFLGPNRNGISAERDLLDSYPAGGWNVVWRAECDVGMSGVAVVGRHAVTLHQDEAEQAILCFDALDGRRLWRTPIAPAYRNSMGNGPRATPAIVGPRVIAFSGEGILAAVELADGKLIWKHDLRELLQAKTADYGMSCSPLIVDEWVVLTPGASGASIVAFEAATGKLAWKSSGDVAGYSSPARLTIGGRDQIVAFTGESARGLDLRTGRSLWSYPYETDYLCNIATPLAIGGRLFLSSGENHGCVLLDFAPQGDDLTPRVAWQSLGPQSVMRNEWQTSILLDGYLYGFDNVGSAGPVTNFACIEAATGKPMWSQKRFGKGNLLAADGKLFITTMIGELILVRANPERYEELGRAAILGGSRQAPSLAQGRLYLRDNVEVVCVDVRGKP